jgi:PleD family two-component response regulator
MPAVRPIYGTLVLDEINDQYRHLDGDRVLQDLTRACQHGLGTEDMFARYGGEVRRAAPRGAHRRRCLGCTEDSSADALIHVADQRLYEAKQAGRGRVVAGGQLSR